MKIIELKNLGFDYGEGWIFHKLNIEIEEGDFVAVIGANGAGKSTLLKMLAHIVPPTSGTIEYYGEDISTFNQWDKIGYVPQNPAKQQQNFPISVEEVVKLGLLKPNKLWQHFGPSEQEALEKSLAIFSLNVLTKTKLNLSTIYFTSCPYFLNENFLCAQ